MNDRLFGISSHVFHESTLTSQHLAQIAEHGFGAVEIFATRSHFDFHDPVAIDTLDGWLKAAGLVLHSLHAPIVNAMRDGQWVGSHSIAATDARRRGEAIDESRAALDVARVIPYRYLVLHLGVPGDVDASGGDNDVGHAHRSLEVLAEHAATVGVRLAVEVIPNAMSAPEALVDLIESKLDERDLGVCLDYGHAHLLGEVADAVECLSGHVFTTHVHDNKGERDEHLVPFEGTIDWDVSLMETQKVGYDGAFIFEVAGAGNHAAVLQRTAAARQRFEKRLSTL